MTPEHKAELRNELRDNLMSFELKTEHGDRVEFGQFEARMIAIAIERYVDERLEAESAS